MIQLRDRPMARMSASLLPQCLSSISFTLWLHLSLLFDIQLSCFLSLSSPHPFVSWDHNSPALHVQLLFHLFILSLLFLPVSAITRPITSHGSGEQISTLCPSSNHDISRSNFTSNGVTLAQRDIYPAETQWWEHDRETELKMAYSKRQQIHSNTFVCPRRVENQRGRYKHTNTDLERQEELASTRLTLPVSHENVGRQQTLPDALCTSCLSSEVTDLCECKRLYSQYKWQVCPSGAGQ